MKVRSLLALLLVVTSCGPRVSPPEAPNTPWVPPKDYLEELPPAPKASEAAAEDYARIWSLPELIQLGLRNNPQTRSSFLRAEIAAEQLNGSRSEYYPQINFGGKVTRLRQDFGNAVQRTDKGPIGTIDYLLFDFGRREAKIDALRDALAAANFDHNAQMQNVVFSIEQAYYTYIGLKSLAAAQQATVNETKKNLEAAQARKEAGVATVADLLQAQTAVAGAELVLQQVRGEIDTIRGAVATSVGVSPTVPFDTPADFGTADGERLSEPVENLIARAQQDNPAVGAARARVLQASNLLTAQERAGWPTIRGNSQLAQYYREMGERSENYALTIQLTFPLFTGFAYTHAVRQAEAEKKLAESQLQDTAQAQALNIWTDYTRVQTAAARIISARALVDSATQSQDVTLGRYKEGLGNILDLLSSQRALSEARAQSIQARADYLISLAMLRRDVGSMLSSNPAPVQSSSTQSNVTTAATQP